MSAQTGIAWTESTFNPWWGCTRVSPACDHCYAETVDANRHGAGKDAPHWGPRADRLPASERAWQEPLALDRRAARAGIRRRIFCASMGDIFDNHGSIRREWRDRLWSTIRATPNLDWQLLTKRPGNARRYLPADWGAEGYGNVWLGITAEDQDHLDQRVDQILSVPAAAYFVSAEPLLGPLVLPANFLALGTRAQVIIGGESGPRANCRPFAFGWARAILDQCRPAQVAFFMKQAGSLDPIDEPDWRRAPRDGHGKQFDSFPADLRVREYPSGLNESVAATCQSAAAGAMLTSQSTT